MERVEVLIGLVSLGLLLASRHTMEVLQVDFQVLYTNPPGSIGLDWGTGGGAL
jgi:hypothetical protein